MKLDIGDVFEDIFDVFDDVFDVDKEDMLIIAGIGVIIIFGLILMTVVFLIGGWDTILFFSLLIVIAIVGPSTMMTYHWIVEGDPKCV